jgi:hypothetical protein
MRPLPDPIPPEQARALADRLLEVYAPDDPEKGDDRARMAAIAVLGEFDLDRALDRFENVKVRADDLSGQNTRASLEESLAEKDPARAQAMVEAIPNPLARTDALVRVAKALPDSECGRKRVMLERATVLLGNDLRQANTQRLIRLASALAEQWLDLGERDRARPSFEVGRSIYDPMPPTSAGAQPEFLTQLARVEPDQALERLWKLTKPQVLSIPHLLYDPPAAVAVALATDHPAEAERAFNLWERTGIQYPTNYYAMQLCRRLAQVDPSRARRIAAAQRGPSERALAWASVALGFGETNQAGALEAVDRSIREIDRLRESGPGPDPVIILGSIRLMYPTNPAPLILPIVERVAPERLAEVFWRAVALHPRLDPDRRQDLRSS